VGAVGGVCAIVMATATSIIADWRAHGAEKTFANVFDLVMATVGVCLLTIFQLPAGVQRMIFEHSALPSPPGRLCSTLRW
jgi:hypothetical protein